MELSRYERVLGDVSSPLIPTQPHGSSAAAGAAIPHAHGAAFLDPCEGLRRLKVPPVPWAGSRLALPCAQLLVYISPEQTTTKAGLHT